MEPVRPLAQPPAGPGPGGRPQGAPEGAGGAPPPPAGPGGGAPPPATPLARDALQEAIAATEAAVAAVEAELEAVNGLDTNDELDVQGIQVLERYLENVRREVAMLKSK